MKERIEKLLGPSWRTSLAGLISGICAFLAFYPDLLSPLPDYWENALRQLLAFLIAMGVIELGVKSRDEKKSEETLKMLTQKIEKIKDENS